MEKEPFGTSFLSVSTIGLGGNSLHDPRNPEFAAYGPIRYSFFAGRITQLDDIPEE